MTKEFFNQKLRVFAHRGLPLEYPENTLLSFEKSIELGVDVIETDVHFTKDNKFVILHDNHLGRISNGEGNVADYSLKELKKFDLGYNFTKDGKTYPYRGAGQTFFSLEEMIEKFPIQRFSIDLKDENPKQVKYYVDIIKKYNAESQMITASKHYVNLKEVRKLLPEVATSFSIKEAAAYYFLFKTRPFFEKFFNADALQIPDYLGPLHVANKSLIKHANSMRMNVYVWTIDKEEDMIRLFNDGAEGIVTNDSKLLKKVVGEYFDCNLNKVCF